jgi:hypothetical protein
LSSFGSSQNIHPGPFFERIYCILQGAQIGWIMTAEGKMPLP